MVDFQVWHLVALLAFIATTTLIIVGVVLLARLVAGTFRGDKRGGGSGF